MGAGVVRIKGTDRALAMSVDGNGRYCYLDPYRGAMLAVAEAAATSPAPAARPLAATNCLNFGNPERPEIMWQFAEAVEGIGDACRALDVPIIGGNVSLYNETDGNAIYPTPIIGVVGLLEHADRVVGRRFQACGRRRSSCSARARRARRQRVPEGRRTTGARRAACARSRGASGRCRICSSRWQTSGWSGRRTTAPTAAWPWRSRSAASTPTGSAPKSRSTRCEVARDPRSNVAAALFGESASRVVVSVAPDDVTRRARAGGGGGRAGAGHRADRREPSADRRRRRGSASICRRRGRAGLVDGASSAYFAKRDGLKNMFDKFKDECGVFGIFGHPEAANMTYLGLYALQHRGQESAGIAASDGAAGPHLARDGLRRRHLRRRHARASCPGRWRSAMSATRRPARASCSNAQPILIDCAHGQIALCHNGNLVNAERAARRARAAGVDLPVEQRHRGHPAPVRALEGAEASRTRSSNRCRRSRARSRS